MSSCSDSFLSLSSALTVLKQEISSPFGNDHVKKIAKALPLNKDQVDEIQLATDGAANKNTTNGQGNNATNVANITCHLNGNSNSSASNDLVNCLDNVAQIHQQTNNQNDERNDLSSKFKNHLQKECAKTISFISLLQKQTMVRQRRKKPLKNPSNTNIIVLKHKIL